MAAPINDTTKVNEIITALEGNTLEQLVPDGGDWLDKINQAWNMLGIDLRLKRDIDLTEINTVDDTGADNGIQQQLTYAQAFKTLKLIFFDNLDNVNADNEETFKLKADEYEGKYQEIISQMVIPIDVDADGTTDTDSEPEVRLVI